MAAATSPLVSVDRLERLAKDGAHEGARARTELQDGLRDVTTSDRQARCGLAVIAEHGECPTLTLTRRGDGESGWRAKWRGVLMCGRIWTCPVCSAKKRALKSLRVEDALRMWGETPGAARLAQMVTFTVRHHGGMLMSHVFEVLRAAWRRFKMGGLVQAILNGRTVYADGCLGRCKHGSEAVGKRGGKVKGSIRAFEVTRDGDKNGFHPHVHVVWLFEQLLTMRERQYLRRRWIECVRHVDPACVPDEAHALAWSNP
jgi:hypothetical protein